ncbi:MAG: hypothetical protein IPM77_17475 [Crocinitomicaceae bacterium]|nr:hypothetical protein [Crocinitomicaceae bacterium]
MIKLFGLCITSSFVLSCSNHNDKNINQLIKIGSETARVDNTLNYDQANIGDIASFFDIKIDSNEEHMVTFFLNNKIDPIRWISVDNIELKDSRIAKLKYFSVLILVNPAETSVNLFFKHNGREVKFMIEDKYIPDDVKINVLNDTLVMCHLFWKYQFGPHLENVSKYYFFGERTGVFDNGYYCTDSELNLTEQEIQNGGFLFHSNSGSSVYVQDDTIKYYGNLKK